MRQLPLLLAFVGVLFTLSRIKTLSESVLAVGSLSFPFALWLAICVAVAGWWLFAKSAPVADQDGLGKRIARRMMAVRFVAGVMALLLVGADLYLNGWEVWLEMSALGTWAENMGVGIIYIALPTVVIFGFTALSGVIGDVPMSKAEERKDMTGKLWKIVHQAIDKRLPETEKPSLQITASTTTSTVNQVTVRQGERKAVQEARKVLQVAQASGLNVMDFTEAALANRLQVSEHKARQVKLLAQGRLA